VQCACFHVLSWSLAVVVVWFLHHSECVRCRYGPLWLVILGKWSSVSLSFGLLLLCANATEQLEVLLGVDTVGNSANIVLDGIPISYILLRYFGPFLLVEWCCSCCSYHDLVSSVLVQAKLPFVEPGCRWAHSPSPSKAPGISYQATMKTSVMML